MLAKIPKPLLWLLELKPLVNVRLVTLVPLLIVPPPVVLNVLVTNSQLLLVKLLVLTVLEVPGLMLVSLVVNVGTLVLELLLGLLPMLLVLARLTSMVTPKLRLKPPQLLVLDAQLVLLLTLDQLLSLLVLVLTPMLLL